MIFSIFVIILGFSSMLYLLYDLIKRSENERKNKK